MAPENRRNHMNIAFAFKNFEPSDHLKKYARRRFEKLGRFLNKSENVEMTVNLAVDKFRHKAEVQFAGDNISLSAVEQSEDMYATVDMVLDKLETQLKKHVEKMKEKRRGVRSDAYAFVYNALVEGRERTITGTEDRFSSKPLYLDEAALQLEQRKDDSFMVFLNAESDRINVLFRRKNGDFGVIDTGR
jgi:putative sigma-54 modulation protein